MANSRLSMATTDRNGSGWPMKSRISQVPDRRAEPGDHVQAQAGPQAQRPAVGGLDHPGDGGGVVAGGRGHPCTSCSTMPRPRFWVAMKPPTRPATSQAADIGASSSWSCAAPSPAAGQQRHADQGVDQLGDHLDGDVHHAGAEGGGGGDAAQHRRPRGDHHPAELGERQHVRGGLAHQPAPDEHRRRAGRSPARPATRPGPAAGTGQLGDDHHQEAAPGRSAGSRPARRRS